MIIVTSPPISIIEKSGITIKNYYAYSSTSNSSSSLSQQTAADNTTLADYNLAAA
jgi:hypothetical protein